MEQTDVRIYDMMACHVYRDRFAGAAIPMEFAGNNLTWFNNIHLQRLMNNDPAAGLNRNKVIVKKEIKPKTPYGYFVKITDADIAGDASIRIFQLHPFFKTHQALVCPENIRSFL